MHAQLFRIDDRLIHGQVVLGWAKPLKSKCILLCDDDISHNEWEKDLYLACVPEDIKAIIYTVQQTYQYLMNENIDVDKTIILVRSPAVIIRLIKLGYKPAYINIGGLHFMESRKQFLHYLYLSLNEINDLKYLLKQNINIYCQDVPSGKKIQISKLIGN